MANSTKSLVQGLGSHNERILRETAAEIKAPGAYGRGRDRSVLAVLLHSEICQHKEPKDQRRFFCCHSRAKRSACAIWGDVIFSIRLLRFCIAVPGSGLDSAMARLYLI